MECLIKSEAKFKNLENSQPIYSERNKEMCLGENKGVAQGLIEIS